MKTPRSINSYLNQGDSHLEPIVSHVQRLKSLQRALFEYLSEPLRSHVLVANYRKGYLILQTDSPVWASKIRYMVPDLIQRLRNMPALGSLRDIRIQIGPVQMTRPEPVKPQPVLSAASRQLLEDTAQGIDDPGLKAALTRLARRGFKS